MLPKWFKDSAVEFVSKEYQLFFEKHGKLNENSANLINSETVFNKPRRKLLLDDTSTLKKSVDSDHASEMATSIKAKITKLE